MTRDAKELRIVVADDHELVRRGIRDLLEEVQGWRVVDEAADASEAVEIMRRLKPDVAILDITMPGMDVLEAMRQISEQSKDTRVLILTIHESDQMVRRFLEAGASGYVLKTDMAKHLVHAVKDVAHGKISLTPKVSEIVLEGFLKTGSEIGSPMHLPVQPTRRETEIIRMLTEGKANKEIAAGLGITVRTVETHRARIMLKLGCHSLSELIRYALQNKIASIPGI